MLRRVLKWLAIGAGALLGVALIVAGVTAWSIYDYGRSSETVRADAAIVLGAAAWGRRPSPVLRERINHGVRLYQEGFVRKIIFTGGQALKTDPAESVVSRRYAMQAGVPATDILIESQSRSTVENLRFAQDVARRNQLTTFLLVSDPLHMKRAVLLAHDLGMTVYSSPTTTSRFQSAESQLWFLARETWFYLRYRVTHQP